MVKIYGQEIVSTSGRCQPHLEDFKLLSTFSLQVLVSNIMPIPLNTQVMSYRSFSIFLLSLNT